MGTDDTLDSKVSSSSETVKESLDRARQSLHKGKLLDAVQEYAGVIKQEPTNIVALAYLSFYHRAHEQPHPDLVLAQKYYERALHAWEQSRATSEDSIAMGRMMYAHNDTDAARVFYRFAQKLSPKSAEPLQCLAGIEQNRQIKIALLKKAHRLDRRNAHILYDLTQLLLETGSRDWKKYSRIRHDLPGNNE